MKRSAVVCGALAFVLLSGLPAKACSCAPVEARDALHHSDGAMIGTLISRTPHPDNTQSSTYTFQVDEDFKGNLGDTVEVESATDGAACGLEVGIGSKTGLFLDRASGAWHSSLCAQVAPQELRDAAAPLPEPNGSGPLTTVVAGSWGRVSVMGLARGGKTLAYGFGDHDYGDVTTCPGSKRILEWFDTRKGWRLSVRKAETMETISTQDLRFSPGFEDRLYYLDVACRSRSGDSFAVAAEDSRGRLKLIRYSNGERSRLYDDQASLKALDGRHLYLTQEGAARRLKVFNMRTDQVHFVARFPARPWQVALSPDRSKVAAMTSSEKPLLMVVDRGTNPHTTHTRRLDEYASGRLLWIDDDELGFFGGGGDFGGIKLFKPSLDVSRKVGGPWYANDSVRVGDAVYGIGWGTLFRWDTAEANSHVLREFQSPNIGSIAGTS